MLCSPNNEIHMFVLCNDKLYPVDNVRIHEDIGVNNNR